MTILEPILIRWRERKACSWCFEPAKMRCKCHKVSLCGGPNCTMVHRYFHSSDVTPSLTKEACQFVALNTWFDYAFQSVVVILVGMIFAWAVLLI
jgi:hypothetical protein